MVLDFSLKELYKVAPPASSPCYQALQIAYCNSNRYVPWFMGSQDICLVDSEDNYKAILIEDFLEFWPKDAHKGWRIDQISTILRSEENKGTLILSAYSLTEDSWDDGAHGGESSARNRLREDKNLGKAEQYFSVLMFDNTLDTLAFKGGMNADKEERATSVIDLFSNDDSKVKLKPCNERLQNLVIMKIPDTRFVNKCRICLI